MQTQRHTPLRTLQATQQRPRHADDQGEHCRPVDSPARQWQRQLAKQPGQKQKQRQKNRKSLHQHTALTTAAQCQGQAQLPAAPAHDSQKKHPQAARRRAHPQQTEADQNHRCPQSLLNHGPSCLVTHRLRTGKIGEPTMSLTQFLPGLVLHPTSRRLHIFHRRHILRQSRVFCRNGVPFNSRRPGIPQPALQNQQPQHIFIRSRKLDHVLQPGLRQLLMRLISLPQQFLHSHSVTRHQLQHAVRTRLDIASTRPVH